MNVLWMVWSEMGGWCCEVDEGGWRKFEVLAADEIYSADDSMPRINRRARQKVNA